MPHYFARHRELTKLAMMTTNTRSSPYSLVVSRSARYAHKMRRVLPSPRSYNKDVDMVDVKDLMEVDDPSTAQPSSFDYISGSTSSSSLAVSQAVLGPLSSISLSAASQLKADSVPCPPLTSTSDSELQSDSRLSSPSTSSSSPDPDTPVPRVLIVMHYITRYGLERGEVQDSRHNPYRNMQGVARGAEVYELGEGSQLSNEPEGKVDESEVALASVGTLPPTGPPTNICRCRICERARRVWRLHVDESKDAPSTTPPGSPSFSNNSKLDKGKGKADINPQIISESTTPRLSRTSATPEGSSSSLAISRTRHRVEREATPASELPESTPLPNSQALPSVALSLRPSTPSITTPAFTGCLPAWYIASAPTPVSKAVPRPPWLLVSDIFPLSPTPLTSSVSINAMSSSSAVSTDMLTVTTSVVEASPLHFAGSAASPLTCSPPKPFTGASTDDASPLVLPSSIAAPSHEVEGVFTSSHAARRTEKVDQVRVSAHLGQEPMSAASNSSGPVVGLTASQSREGIGSTVLRTPKVVCTVAHEEALRGKIRASRRNRERTAVLSTVAAPEVSVSGSLPSYDWKCPRDRFQRVHKVSPLRALPSSRSLLTPGFSILSTPMGTRRVVVQDPHTLGFHWCPKPPPAEIWNRAHRNLKWSRTNKVLEKPKKANGRYGLNNNNDDEPGKVRRGYGLMDDEDDIGEPDPVEVVDVPKVHGFIKSCADMALPLVRCLW